MRTTAGPGTVRHFLDLDHFDQSALRHILETGLHLKREGPNAPRPLVGRSLAMIFEKPSTRTRVSFEVGMRQLGGDVVILNAHDMQLGRGETISDTARVLSRYVDAIMLRTASVENLQELAQHASIPVINGLTSSSHPCQVMADIMTFEEHRGPIEGCVVAWSGDGNNVAQSWIHAAVRFDFELRLACPESLSPSREIMAWARDQGGRVVLMTNPEAAVRGADCVVTDTWVSMNHRDPEERHAMLAPFRVDQRLMDQAKPEAVFMHCLPAHRGEEVTAEVIDGPRSVVWDEAENRLHVQKAILLWCLDS